MLTILDYLLITGGALALLVAALVMRRIVDNWRWYRRQAALRKSRQQAALGENRRGIDASWVEAIRRKEEDDD